MSNPWLRMFLLFTGVLLLPSGCVCAGGTNAAPQVTVETRDGSRVIGRSISGTFRFHSPLLGEVKLPIADIRSVDCVSTNSARLVTSEGDTLTVTFAESTFAMDTGFGKIDLNTHLVRKLTVTTSGQGGTHPAGLVALWPGEGNGQDVVGHNDAQLIEMRFADGQVGQAFSLNGFSSWMKIPASPSLNVGSGEGLTITAWINPVNADSFHPIFEWSPTGHPGVQLWLGQRPNQHGVLYGAVPDTDGNVNWLASPPGAVVAGKFQQVAMTYDKNSGVAILYVNGTVVAKKALGTFTPETDCDLLISRRPGDYPGAWTYNAFFGGLIDEIAVYNRALKTTEIESLCRDENHGTLPPPPNPLGGIRDNGFY